jgi:beta-lactamase regulating signal transducer with metallopeptidase domain
MTDSLPTSVAYVLDGLLAGSVLLAIGFVVSVFAKQPIVRLRALEITLGGTLIAASIALLPGLPGWSIAVTETESGKVADSTNAPSTTGAVSADVLLDERYRNGQLSLSDYDQATASLTVQPINQVVVSDVLGKIGVFVGWAYIAGLVGIACWWLVGIGLLARIVSRSEDASDLFQSIMKTLAGKTHRVRIVVSDRVRQPIAFRLSERVIVIPQRLASETNTHNIHHVLAHEWSHIERGDWWTWLLANIVRAVFFFHPAAWWVRQQVRLTQDYVADARAADQADSRLDYAEFLTRQAAVARQPVLAVGLGMRGRRSELYRRVVSLVKGDGHIATECPASRTFMLFAPAALLALCCGSVNVFSEQTAVAESTDTPLVLDASSFAKSQSKFDFDVLTEGELQVQFEDNDESLCFQLTAVGDVSHGKPRWWEPDGKLLSKSPRQITERPAMNRNDESGRAFLLHMWKNDRVAVRWRIPNSETRLLHEESIRIGERQLTTTVLSSDWRNAGLPDTAKMWVGYAAGPWSQFETHPHPDCPIKITRESLRGSMKLKISGPLYDHEIKIVATDRNGHEKEIAVEANYGQQESLISLPGLDERNIDCLQLSVRRFKWIQFEDISLNANQPSQPRAIRRAL